MIGQKLGPYELIEEVGRGGMAAVYRAKQPNMDRFVAVKVIYRSIAADPKALDRFNREARLIARLEHPHILPVYDYNGDNDPPYIVMRFMGTGTLRDVMNRAKLPIGEVSVLLNQVASALDYAHRQGVVHRDIKPTNIMIDGDGNAFLTDFGIARMVEASGEGGLTATGITVGTPGYMSPEQGMGTGIDSRADVYSLGVMAYEMLAGKMPFTAETPMAVVLKHISEPVPDILLLSPELPPHVSDILRKSMAKKPDERYATCGDFARDFAEAIGPKATGTPAKLQQTAVILERERASRTGLPPQKLTAESTIPLATGNTPMGGTVLVPKTPTGTLNSTGLRPTANRSAVGIAAVVGLIALAIIGVLIGTLIVNGNNQSATQTAQAIAALSTSQAQASQTVQAVALVNTQSAEGTQLAVNATNTQAALPTQTASFTPTLPPTLTLTFTAIPPTETPIPATLTAIPPTVPPTLTPIPPTSTPIPPTETPLPPTATFTFTPIPPTLTFTPIPPTFTPSPIPPSATPPPPILNVVSMCNVGNVIYAITNGGGSMTRPFSYSVNSNNATVASGSVFLTAQATQQVTVQGTVGRTYTLTIRDGEDAIATVFVECTRPPLLTATGVCADRVITFKVTNSGGTMNAPYPYRVTRGDQTVNSGALQIAATSNQTIAFPGTDGQTYLLVVRNEADTTNVISVSAICAAPPTVPPTLPPTFTPVPPTAAPPTAIPPTVPAGIVPSATPQAVAVLPLGTMPYITDFERDDAINEYDFDGAVWKLLPDSGNTSLVGTGGIQKPAIVLGKKQPEWTDAASRNLVIGLNVNLDSTASIGRIIFRYSAKGYYVLELLPGTIRLVRGPEGNNPINRGSERELGRLTNAPLRSNQFYNWLIWADDSRIFVYQDYKLMLQIRDAGDILPGGFIGLQTLSQGTAYPVRFDNLKVQRPSGVSSHFTGSGWPGTWDRTNVTDVNVAGEAVKYIELLSGSVAPKTGPLTDFFTAFRLNNTEGGFEIRLRESPEGAFVLRFDAGNMTLFISDSAGKERAIQTFNNFYERGLFLEMAFELVGERLTLINSKLPGGVWSQSIKDAPKRGEIRFSVTRVKDNLRIADFLLAETARSQSESAAWAFEKIELVEGRNPQQLLTEYYDSFLDRTAKKDWWEGGVNAPGDPNLDSKAPRPHQNGLLMTHAEGASWRLFRSVPGEFLMFGVGADKTRYFDSTDVYVRVYARLDKPGTAWVQARTNKTVGGGGLNGYQLAVTKNADGTYIVSAAEIGATGQRTEYYRGPIPVSATSEKDYPHLLIVTYQNKVAFFVNGRFIAGDDNTSILGGTVAIGVEPGTTARFDTFQLRDVSPETR